MTCLGPRPTVALCCFHQTQAANRAALGPIGRLGRLSAKHRGRVFVAWALIAVGLGILAPRVETALSGAGWQANGSQSVEAREQIDRNFAGAGSYALQVVVHSQDLVATAPGFRETVARSQRVLRRDPAVRRVAPPRPGLSISPDGHTAVIRAGAARRSERDGRRRRPPQDQARRRRSARSCRQPDRRLRRCGRTSIRRTGRRCSSPSSSPGR